MDTYDDSMEPRFRQQLEQRERQLRALLQQPGEAGAEPGHEVEDFKDIATRESQTAVDEVQSEHAARDLQQVLAALARMDSHSYGQCLQCGEAIDLRRLDALPATPLCIACQSRNEGEPRR